MLDQAKNAVDIYRHGSVPLLIGHAVDGRILRRPDAVIRDQDVEPPESGHRRRYQLPSRLGAGKFALHGAAIRGPAFAHERVSLILGGLIVEDDLRARSHEEPHGSRANATRAAGDKSNFGIKRKVHRL